MAVTPNIILIMACLTIATYNCHGLGSGRLEYINKLAEVNDFLFLQEHWMLSDQINTFGRKVNSMHVHGVSGMKEHELLEGRPYGGCAILWKKSLVCKVTPVDVESKRVCAVHVSDANGLNLLMCNVYMPCDTNYGNADAYLDILAELSQIAEKSDSHKIVVGGDFNTDLSRSRSLNTDALIAFMENEWLKVGLQYRASKVDYTFESKANGERSLIDHFLVSDNLFDCINKYEVVHEGDNLSDHSALCMGLDISTVCETLSSDDPVFSPSWSSASLENIRDYQISLDSILESIIIPWEAFTCQNYFCTKHCSAIETFHNDVINACINASSSTIPHAGSASPVKKGIPGWNEKVKELRDQAIFWHNIWKDNNSPREGILADIRRRTRSRYHYALRDVKKNKDRYIANSMAESLLAKNKHNFWTEVRKMKGQHKVSTNTVDGATSQEDIADLFGEKYRKLYNSVSFNEIEMKTLVRDIESEIKSKCCHGGSCKYEHNITVSDCAKAILHLKSGKHDGLTGHTTDHLIHGTHRLHCHLSLLYSGMLNHGFSPTGLMLSTVVSIPKCKRKSLNDSTNYRGIALSSVLGKVLDWVILTRYRDVLDSSDCQFGFKPGHSTTQCTFVVQETVQYYLNGGSHVNAVLLDASKAFDRVQYIKLFRLLLKKGICPLLARFLCAMYTHQLIRVRWNNFTTAPFGVSNGVKQGGVLSPILFSVYMDELIGHLMKAGYGCHIGHIFVGALVYADDIVLLAPTLTAARKMLCVVKQFSIEYDVKFNPSKCQHIVFGKNGATDTCLSLDGIKIELVSSSKHLGVLIGEDIENTQLTQSIADFTKRVNGVLAHFGTAFSDVKYKLFTTFCMSLYGCPLWDLSHKRIGRFCIAWRKSVRRLLSIPPRTHNTLLPLICGDHSIDVQLHSRFVSFFCGLLSSSNQVIAICGQLSLSGSSSSISNSLNHICHKYNLIKHDLAGMGKITARRRIFKVAAMSHSYEDYVHAGCIRDLLILRDRQSSHFTQREISELLMYLCMS